MTPSSNSPTPPTGRQLAAMIERDADGLVRASAFASRMRLAGMSEEDIEALEKAAEGDQDAIEGIVTEAQRDPGFAARAEELRARLEKGARAVAGEVKSE